MTYPDPRDVRLFGLVAVVAGADRGAHPIEQAGLGAGPASRMTRRRLSPRGYADCSAGVMMRHYSRGPTARASEANARHPILRTPDRWRHTARQSVKPFLRSALRMVTDATHVMARA